MIDIGLNNLKAIFNIQKSGNIQVMIRDVRASKDQIDDTLKNIKELRKSLSQSQKKRKRKRLVLSCLLLKK